MKKLVIFRDDFATSNEQIAFHTISILKHCVVGYDRHLVPHIFLIFSEANMIINLTTKPSQA